MRKLVNFERIQCPTDLSRESEGGLRYAVALARAQCATIFGSDVGRVLRESRFPVPAARPVNHGPVPPPPKEPARGIIEMLVKFHQMLAAHRRRRALVKIRREFARYGYPLDGMPDVEIEAALPPGMCETPPDYIGPKTISRALGRLSIGTTRRSGGKVSQAPAPGRASRGRRR